MVDYSVGVAIFGLILACTIYCIIICGKMPALLSWIKRGIIFRPIFIIGLILLGCIGFLSLPYLSGKAIFFLPAIFSMQQSTLH